MTDARKAPSEPPRGLARWMEAYIDGDPASFRRIYDALAPRLTAFLTNMVRDRTAVDDLVQVTFLKGHAARDKFRTRSDHPDASVQAWYFTIARHAALDHLRSRQRSSRRAARAEAADLPAQAAGDAPADPERAHLEREQAEQDIASVRAAIEALPAGQREVLTLHKIEGLPMKEIARRLGIREGAVRVRAHRAYRALARALGVEED